MQCCFSQLVLQCTSWEFCCRQRRVKEPTRVDKLWQPGSVIDLGRRFKRVEFMESRTLLPNSHIVFKALDFIVDKRLFLLALSHWYYVTMTLKKSKFNFSLFISLSWNFAKRHPFHMVLGPVLGQHLSAVTFANRLRFQTDKGNSIATFALRMYRMHMHLKINCPRYPCFNKTIPDFELSTIESGTAMVY